MHTAAAADSRHVIEFLLTQNVIDVNALDQNVRDIPPHS